METLKQESTRLNHEARNNNTYNVKIIIAFVPALVIGFVLASLYNEITRVFFALNFLTWMPAITKKQGFFIPFFTISSLALRKKSFWVSGNRRLHVKRKNTSSPLFKANILYLYCND